jgi:hypothetical protein
LRNDVKKCDCGRSPTANCIGWHKLTHPEWQVKKLIFEAETRAEKIAEEYSRILDQKNWRQ